MQPKPDANNPQRESALPSATLLACPFCGNTARHHEGNDFVLYHNSACFFTQHYAQEMWLCGTRQINKWNARQANNQAQPRAGHQDHE